MTFQPSHKSYHLIGFVALQAVVLIAGIGIAWASFSETKQRRVLPALREEPRTVEPLYDYPWVVDDERLHGVLHKLRPRLRGPEPKINHVDHALRFWGVDATFADPQCLSGRELRDMLVNHDRFIEAWGPEAKPLLIPGSQGVAVRTKEGSPTASHVDHTIAGLAEAGLPIDFPVRLPTAEATVRDILEHSLRSFDLNQVEYEWSALAYALYLKSADPWFASAGQEITFDRLADRIMRQRLRLGVCFGNHRLHTLVVLLRVDEQHPILSPECREKILRHLKRATATLVASQRDEGCWDERWAQKPTDAPTSSTDTSAGDQLDPLSRRLLATGHALEWWALAPKETHPPRDVLVRAGHWLSRTIVDMDDEAIKKNYTFLTHAGRSLALWRGHFPDHFIASIDPTHETLLENEDQ